MNCPICEKPKCFCLMEDRMHAIRAQEKRKTAIGDDKLPAETLCNDEGATT